MHTLPDSDYVRTRLTHSLEVSSVGRSLGVQVFRDCLADKNFISSADFSSIVAAACLAHDIGNPPFGHDGEAADSPRNQLQHLPGRSVNGLNLQIANYSPEFITKINAMIF